MSTLITKPGAVYDMPEHAYHADPCPASSISGTMAATIMQPGGLAKLKTKKQIEPTPAMRLGSAAHAVTLGAGPALVMDEYMTPSGAQSTKAEAKEWRAKQEAKGLQVVTPAMYEKAHTMAEIVHSHPEVSQMFSGGRAEVSIFDYDQAARVWLRGRIDYITNRKLVIDYKTTNDASQHTFWRNIGYRGYHVQAAHYMRIARRLDLINEDATWMWIAQETEAPYLVAVYELDTDDLERSIQVDELAIKRWARALAADEWPGYPTKPVTLRLAEWMFPDVEELAKVDEALAAAEFDAAINTIEKEAA